jgi:hypothetical protein
MKDKIEQAISKALEKEPAFELPAGFADRVVKMVDGKVAEEEARRDRWWLWLGLFSMAIAFMYAAAAVDFVTKVGTLFSGYTGLVVFGLFFITALHFIDKLIISKNRVER